MKLWALVERTLPSYFIPESCQNVAVVPPWANSAFSVLSFPSSPTVQCITTGTLRLKMQLFAQGSLPQFVSLSPVHNFSQNKARAILGTINLREKMLAEKRYRILNSVHCLSQDGIINDWHAKITCLSRSNLYISWSILSHLANSYWSLVSYGIHTWNVIKEIYYVYGNEESNDSMRIRLTSD